jgi:hypothetical protein
MPTNIVDIPFLNPLRFVPVGSTAKNFDSDWYFNQIKSFEQQIQYYQKWVYGDVIYLQVLSNFAPVVIELLDCSGNSLNTFSFTVKSTSLVNPGYTVYECSIPVPTIDEGVYYFLLKVGSYSSVPEESTLEQFISEPQYFSADAENTILFQYKNSYNRFDVIFETGINFGFRCDAVIGAIDPQSKDTVWEDQPLNLRTITSTPYRHFKLTIGNSYGVPDWVVDKVNRLFSCDTVLIDGRQYTKAEGAKWEVNQAELYPMRGWKIDIRETNNRYSLRGQNNNSPAEQFAVVYNIESKAFGTFNGNASNNIIQVTEVE